MNDPKLYNGLTLAYIGDSIYELYVRKYFVEEGLSKVDDLHKKVVYYTCAEHQSKVIKSLIDNNFLIENEIDYFKRGRNSKVNKTRKTLSTSDYLAATGFESLLGYLYLKGNIDRLEEIVKISLGF